MIAPNKMIRDILTRNAFLNAIVIVNIIGGSTNAVSVLNDPYLFQVLMFQL